MILSLLDKEVNFFSELNNRAGDKGYLGESKFSGCMNHVYKNKVEIHIKKYSNSDEIIKDISGRIYDATIENNGENTALAFMLKNGLQYEDVNFTVNLNDIKMTNTGFLLCSNDKVFIEVPRNYLG